jgi:hypothetical protein
VILLENSNEWNLSPPPPAKEGSSKKRGARIGKIHVSKKRKKERMKFTSCWERFYQKKERRSHFPIMKNLLCGLIHSHTSFAFALPSIL